MKHGSLFSGIGGFDLAAEWMGWENVFHCEWNEFGQRVLKHYWPKATSYYDITKTDFTIHRGGIDILTGGFPCQPYSAAGKRLGKEDERHLWPEMLRAIREIQPRWVVGENVLGLVNWNGGLVFEEVQADLEAEGYEVQPFILPAAGVDAPHRRDRVWFVAHSNERNDRRIPQKDEGESGAQWVQERHAVRQFAKSGEVQRNAPDSVREGFRKSEGRSSTTTEGKPMRHFAQCAKDGNAPNSDINGGTQCREGSKGKRKASNAQEQEERGQHSERTDESHGLSRNAPDSIRQTNWENFPTQPPICGGDDGLPTELDGITFPKWRAESIKAYGNAVVPQVVYQIFKAIQGYTKG